MVRFLSAAKREKARRNIRIDSTTAGLCVKIHKKQLRNNKKQTFFCSSYDLVTFIRFPSENSLFATSRLVPLISRRKLLTFDKRCRVGPAESVLNAQCLFVENKRKVILDFSINIFYPKKLRAKNWKIPVKPSV